MKLLLLTLLFALCGLAVSAQVPKSIPPIESGVSRDLAAWRAAHYSDIRYKLSLTLEKMSPVLKGTIEIRVRVKMPAPGVIPVILDWRRMPGHEKDSTITNATINGIEVILPPPPGKPDEELRVEDVAPKFEQNGDHLIFENTVVGENVIKLDFTSPILTSGSGVTRHIDKDGSEYVNALFGPGNASTAFPVFDQPDLKAKFSLQVVAPEDWRIVSNARSEMPITIDDFGVDREAEWLVCGENDKCHQDYKKIHYHSVTGFLETKPISIYDFRFNAGPKK